MFKKTITLFTVITFSILHAQNEIDALRFSLFNNYNTAGISALGGAGGLLSPSHNPASLAFFSGDRLLSVSLGNTNSSVETNYLNTQALYERPFDIAPFIQNIGYVQSLPFATNNDWNRINMAFSFNRKYDFNKNVVMTGYNNSSSIINMFLENVQGLTLDELTELAEPGIDDVANVGYWPGYLAYWADVIDSDDINNTSYYSHAYSEGQNQIMEIYENGYINELDIAFSGAYKDFLFVGASVGITEINFTQETSYVENNFDQSSLTPETLNDINPLSSFEYNQILIVTGEGVNFKFGSFIKPTSFLRLGWAYHSKTYAQMTEGYNALMRANFLNGDNYGALSPTINRFKYDLYTPAKSIASIGLITSYKKLRMLMTFDYETIDYGSSNFTPNWDYSFYEENENIRDLYTRTNNMKLGISCSMNNMSIRGGYSIFGSPFNNEIYDYTDEDNGERKYISAGLGFKKGQYSFDIAMIHCTQNEDYILYQDPTLESPDQIANINYASNTVILTCNYKF